MKGINTFTGAHSVFKACKELLLKKHKDYSSSWTIMRASSLTDQIWIKVKRVRSAQKHQIQKVKDEPISDSLIGIINYSIMALYIIREGSQFKELSLEEVDQLFDKEKEEILDLLEKKNHDYGEAWRDMRVVSFTDLTLMKLLRVKQIEHNDGKTVASEGTKANFQDIINYAVFYLIKLAEDENEEFTLSNQQKTENV